MGDFKPFCTVQSRTGIVVGDDADKWLRENDLRYDPKLKRSAVKKLDPDPARWLLSDVDLDQAPREQRIVYFLQAETGGPVKIGHSKVRMFPIRLRNLRSGSPVRLVVRRVIAGNAGLEHALHRHFQHLRIRTDGEWFNVDDELATVSRAQRDLTPSTGSGNIAK